MDSPLVRDPVYQQLNAKLKALMHRDYQLDDQFLTERQIVDRFGVSRATANKALASLVSEGLLEFRKGVGTFIRPRAIAYDVRSLVSFTEKARAAGKVPATELLTFGRVPAAEVEPEARDGLGAEADTLWVLDRLRTADGVPVILEHRYVVEALCPGLTRAEAKGSLYQAWTGRHRLAIGGADEVIRAIPLGREQAAQLGVPARSPALEVTAVGFLADGRRLWWERTLYRADRYEFHTRLGPISSATPARGALRTDAAASGASRNEYPAGGRRDPG
ncbi:MAG: hypothetical protein C0501_23115 [Isosphaera sp.]|nr:hypothetical protein [Isosphaera sp.]